MASLDFEKEKSEFREFYTTNLSLLENANRSFISLIHSLVIHTDNIPISKIEGRVKDKEECIRKFTRKYLTTLEKDATEYSIKDHISDLIGLRIVCLYEDDIEKIKNTISKHFTVIEVTDKIASIENTEGQFGYKGLHLDLSLGDTRKSLPEYSVYSEFNFEIQIRTIIQDSWSVLDHEIKYKKSIPNTLKRRINTLAALFELADREFKEIRNSTEAEIIKEESVNEVYDVENFGPNLPDTKLARGAILTAFGFLKIASHFFSGYEFEAHKVDGFTQEIVSMKPGITRGKFNYFMRENIARVKLYKDDFENGKETLNPYTIMRHCLYLGDKKMFSSILTNNAKKSFEDWLDQQNS